MPGAVFTGGGATVVMDSPSVAYVKVFYPGSSPDRHLKRRADAVAFRAAQIAPKHTGRMAASVRATQNRDERGRFAFGYSVYARTSYTYYVHEGTGPSWRFATGKKMKFAGTNQYSGQIVYPEIVRHPGTPAQPFLRDALIALAG